MGIICLWLPAQPWTLPLPASASCPKLQVHKTTCNPWVVPWCPGLSFTTPCFWNAPSQTYINPSGPRGSMSSKKTSPLPQTDCFSLCRLLYYEDFRGLRFRGLGNPLSPPTPTESNSLSDGKLVPNLSHCGKSFGNLRSWLTMSPWPFHWSPDSTPPNTFGDYWDTIVKWWCTTEKHKRPWRDLGPSVSRRSVRKGSASLSTIQSQGLWSKLKAELQGPGGTQF